MNIYLMLLIPALILSAGIFFINSGLAFYKKYSVAKNRLNSAFEIPSLFAGRYNHMQNYQNGIVAAANGELFQISNTSLPITVNHKESSQSVACGNCAKFSYTHITKRMTLVNTH